MTTPKPQPSPAAMRIVRSFYPFTATLCDRGSLSDGEFMAEKAREIDREMGHVSVLSLELLIVKWEKHSDELRAKANKWEDEHPHHGDEGTRGEASGYISCAQELSRLIKSTP